MFNNKNPLKIKISNARKWISSSFLVITLLLNSGFAYNLKSDLFTIIFLVVASLIFVFYFGILKRKFLCKEFLTSPFFLLSVFIFITFLVNFDFDSWGRYTRQILVLIFSILFVMEIDIRTFSKVFVDFIMFVTLHSLLILILVNFMSYVPPHFIMEGAAGVEENVYYNVYYNFVFSYLNIYHTTRLIGPFWEAGVFATMLIYALILDENINVYSSKIRKKFNTIIFSIAILLTISTAGYILLVIFFVYKILKNSKGNTTKFLNFIIILCSFFSLVFYEEIILLLANIFPRVFNKLTFDSVSKITRLYGPLVDFSVFSKRPIFGVGITSYQELWPYFSEKFHVESRTSTITYFIANFGIPGIKYFITVLTGSLKNKKIILTCRLLIFLIISSILMKEPHYLNLTTTIIIMYMYSGKL